MMVQYLALKAEVEDCLLFYRMGDFFELFFEDAKVAAACLDIALTARGEYNGRPIPMCGVPIHAAEAYLARLIRAGHRVAIAEQTESPVEAKKRGAKSVVSRAIVRVVTAGTLTEEALLDSRAANWLTAVAKAGECWGIAATDISTGRFELTSVPATGLDAELARLGAAEIVSSEPLPGAIQRRAGFDSIAAERRLKERFGVATLDGFGRFDRAALCAAGGLLAYLDEVAREALPFLRPPAAVESGDHMAIDAATRESLELVRSASGDRPAACSASPTEPSPARAPGCSLPISARRCLTAHGSRHGSIWSPGSPRMAGCGRHCAARFARFPISAAHWAASSHGAAARATLPCSATA